MKARIAHYLRETPLLFIGTVLVIAITFRVGIGAVKSASAEPEAEKPAPVMHTPVAAAKTPVAPAAATPVVQAEPTAVVPAMPEPPKPQAKRKVPRVHGKR